MRSDQLKEALLARAPTDAASREKWIASVDRLLAAASAPNSFDELISRLPPKARYLGPGPWMDAIRDSYRA
ncbi:MAG: hypothetical protein WCT14_14910 [Treponemataceae bacterium]